MQFKRIKSFVVILISIEKRNKVANRKEDEPKINK